MANKHRGIYEIHLDQPRKIQFTFGALAELEDKLGMKISQLKDGNVGAKEMLGIVWAGLLKHEKLSYEEVDELLSQAAAEGRAMDILQTVMEAFGMLFGGAKVGNPKDQKVKVGIGNK